jgi:two-component system response regulator FixJ
MAQEKPGQEATVFVVDDDDGMRRALGTLLGTVGFRSALFALPAEFLARYNADEPGCLILDIRMPDMSGLEVQQQLNRVGAMLPVIFITGHGDVPMAVQAMKEGAFQFVQKPFRNQELLDHINHALQFDRDNRKDLAQRVEVQRRVETLTSREKQVMDRVVEGEANKVMAIDLGLSERTVEIHRAKVMEKMDARSIAHLVKMQLTLKEKT